MNIIPPKNFVGWKRGFVGGLPRSQEVADMFTYLQDNYNPEVILEFGYQFGRSATWFLYAFPLATVISFDPIMKTIDNEFIWKLMEEKFRNRFSFRNSFSYEALRQMSKRNIDVDMIFIDGGHTFGAVFDDIETALKLKIPTILIDNMELEQQQRAVKCFLNNLDFVKEFVYYTKNNDGLIHKRMVNLYHVLSYDIQTPV